MLALVCRFASLEKGGNYFKCTVTYWYANVVKDRRKRPTSILLLMTKRCRENPLVEGYGVRNHFEVEY